MNLKFLKIPIYFVLFTICLINSFNVIYELVFPQLPSIRVYEKHLKDMEFPLAVTLCLFDISSKFSKYTKQGYKNPADFFLGKSLFNKSLVGWSGHTKDGQTLGTPQGHNQGRI